jgi:hypothetical protein
VAATPTVVIIFLATTTSEYFLGGAEAIPKHSSRILLGRDSKPRQKSISKMFSMPMALLEDKRMKRIAIPSQNVSDVMSIRIVWDCPT